MQTDQASALDQAMLSLHADLAALLAHQDAQAARNRFAQLAQQLDRALDRLPARSSRPRRGSALPGPDHQTAEH